MIYFVRNDYTLILNWWKTVYKNHNISLKYSYSIYEGNEFDIISKQLWYLEYNFGVEFKFTCYIGNIDIK